jgi:Zn-dependent peptidase ImmA (M78 family)
MNTVIQTPSQILGELGIREPADLDIEAISEFCGATIKYKLLQGCEARIVGYKDRAIITVNSLSKRERQRFSAGHELGHWMRDRGQVAFQCEDKNFTREWSVNNPEYRANRFASDLLLPSPMFKPLARGLPVTFSAVSELASKFQMSLTATAIRFIEHGWLPSMLVCNTDEGRAWFISSSEISGKFWPLDRPGIHTLAQTLKSGGSSQGPKDIRSSEWLNHPKANHYWIKEDSVMLRGQTILSLLWWEDEQQLLDQEEYEERRFSERSDRRENWE